MCGLKGEGAQEEREGTGWVRMQVAAHPDLLCGFVYAAPLL